MADQKLILVTGGAGFIGSHLCARLAKDGHRVISLDNYFTGSRDNHVPARAFCTAECSPGTCKVHRDVDYREGHTKDIEKHVSETPDLIYHLGEYSRVEQSVLEPDLVYDFNTRGTKGVLEFWQKKKCKLVYAGSSTKFGDGGTARDTSPYARSKAENSEKVRTLGDSSKLPYAIAYFYNVYGPRERSGVYGTVVEQFKRMYISGAPCAIVSPGTQERNFTHVLDIVDALVLIGEKGQGDEYSIGNPHAYAIRELAEFFGFKRKISFPERPGNRMTSTLDDTKTRALGWHPERELPTYVKSFITEHSRGVERDPRVIVFSVTMPPVVGLAENAFLQLAKAVPDVQFDVVTARFTRAPMPPLPENVTVYPVGFGIPADKYFLPLLGFFKGTSLMRRHRYLFTWAIMASYAASAAFMLRLFMKQPVLITLADQNLSDLSFVQRIALGLLISRADQVYGTHGAQETRAALSSKVRLPRNSLGEGDAFANALRFAYADIVRNHL